MHLTMISAISYIHELLLDNYKTNRPRALSSFISSLQIPVCMYTLSIQVSTNFHDYTAIPSSIPHHVHPSSATETLPSSFSPCPSRSSDPLSPIFLLISPTLFFAASLLHLGVCAYSSAVLKLSTLSTLSHLLIDSGVVAARSGVGGGGDPGDVNKLGNVRAFVMWNLESQDLGVGTVGRGEVWAQRSIVCFLSFWVGSGVGSGSRLWVLLCLLGGEMQGVICELSGASFQE